METSLIGKALNFGFNEYGFESRVSNIQFNNAYQQLINHIKLNLNKRKLKFLIQSSTLLTLLIVIFKKNNIILGFKYVIINKKKYIEIYLYYYKQLHTITFFKKISKPSQKYYLSLKAIKLLLIRNGNSLLLLSTSKGLFTSIDVFYYNIGGLLLGFYY